ncbi:Hypothetical protein NCS54_01236000 [Fusarium falciforme]|uniref:Hypothetical protein n=1 Tax=Fusarium falciforme TaxID=195108 RepID=UPI0023012A49|nr:Hypothetical protein NCS54_01236000 [Fusarium falciforme]WAO94762.1 Hypothetical protein NCS54_01236000 [Fusarium falciforme]
MHSQNFNKKTDQLSSSANLVSRFLALEQIYSVNELETYLHSLSKTRNTTPDSEPQPTDVVVLCASAILVIAEAVFEWAARHIQKSTPDGNQEHPRRMVLVLCGGIGPSTPFVYDAVKANARYSCIFDSIEGKPEAHVLKVIAERFYGLEVGGSNLTPSRSDLKNQDGLTILMADRSINCGASPEETQKVLESHGIHNPSSITVVQDPAMSRRTVACFESVYSKCAQRPKIASWPVLAPEPAAYGVKLDDGKGLWSMDRFLDRILGEMPGVRDSGHGYRRGSGSSRVDIPDEVEDAWSTVLEGYGSRCFAPTLKS